MILQLGIMIYTHLFESKEIVAQTLSRRYAKIIKLIFKEPEEFTYLYYRLIITMNKLGI